MKYIPEAEGWLATIKRAELDGAEAAKTADQIDPRVEEAFANALVPLERTFVDTLKQAQVMAATSRVRIEALEHELAQVNAEISKLDTLTIDDISAQHPDWEKTANENIADAVWNTEGRVKDPEAH